MGIVGLLLVEPNENDTCLAGLLAAFDNEGDELTVGMTVVEDVTFVVEFKAVVFEPKFKVGKVDAVVVVGGVKANAVEPGVDVWPKLPKADDCVVEIVG